MHLGFALRATLLLGTPLLRVFAEKPSKIDVWDTVVSKSGCPFAINATFNEDLTVLNITYSGNSSSTTAGETLHSCFSWTNFAHEGKNVEMMLPSGKIQGSLIMSEGLSLRVETTLYWTNDQRPQKFSPAKIIRSEPPVAGFSKSMENTEAHPSLCRTDDYRGTSENLAIKSEFFVEKDENSPSSTIAVVVTGVVYSFDIVWKNGCSLPSPSCFYDRTGFRFCPGGG